MSAIFKSLCWAAAMLFLAAGVRFGFMDREAAMTVLLVLPILAVLSLRRRTRCAGRPA
jgi:hypothetical protein